MRRKTSRRASRLATVCMMAVLVLAGLPLSSCGTDQVDTWPVLGDAQAAPPAIVSAGVLRVGVDSSHAPLAGKSGSDLIGLDVDIAAAMAEQLGLKLDVIDISGQNVEELLQEGRVDIVMGFQRETESTVPPFVLVGPYLTTGPAVFSKGVSLPSGGFDLETLSGMPIAAQPSSLSAWQLEQRFGNDAVQTYASLEEVFDAVDTGAISYAAADAVVGAYLSCKYQGIICLGFVDQPLNIYIAINPGNRDMTELATNTLRSLRDNGVIKVIVTKWLGPTATTLVLGSSAITGGDGASGIDTGENLPDPANANSGEAPPEGVNP